MGETRHYRIYATHSTDSRSDATAVVMATTAAVTPSSPPRNLTATAVSGTQIDLSWAAPEDNGGSDITGYRIAVSTSGALGSFNALVEDTGDITTTYSHTDLSAGATRYYRVLAINGAGTDRGRSLYSNLASATTDALPDAPTGLTVMARNDIRIDLSWTAPVNTGSSEIIGYRIQISTTNTNSASFSDLVENTRNMDTSYTHNTGLSVGTAHHYRVSAINGVGVGMASAIKSATTFTVPDAPISLTAIASSDTQIDLSWTAPTDNGGSLITGYLIEVSMDGNTFSSLVANTESTTTTYEHMGLMAGDTRHYRVSALNLAGISAASSVVFATSGSSDLVFSVTEIPTETFVNGFPITNIILPEATGGTPPLQYTVEPATLFGMLFDANTRTLSGTPTVDGLTGSVAYTRTYRVTDAGGDTETLEFRFNVEQDTQASFIGEPPEIPDQSYTRYVDIGTVSLLGAQGNRPLTYTLIPELPMGLTFDTTVDPPEITGIPIVPQALQGYTYRVTDANGDTNTVEFNLEVVEAGQLSFGGAMIPDQSYTQGHPVQVLLPEVATRRFPASTLVYTLAPELPTGLSFDGSGSLVLSGTPEVAAVSREYTYTVTETIAGIGVTVPAVTASLTFNLEVAGESGIHPYSRGCIVFSSQCCGIDAASGKGCSNADLHGDGLADRFQF